MEIQKKKQRQTQSFIFNFIAATSTADQSVSINVPFKVKRVILKTFVSRSSEAANEGFMSLVYFDMLPVSARNTLFCVPRQYYVTSNIPEDFSLVPNVSFYYDEPISINGSYNIGLRSTGYSIPPWTTITGTTGANYSLSVFFQLEFESE